MLRGKIDGNRLRTIASRLRNAETETGDREAGAYEGVRPHPGHSEGIP